MELEALPPMDRSKWKRVRLGDVVRCVDQTSRDPRAEGLTRVVGLEHLDPGELKITRWADIADGTSFTRTFRAGQVLFGKRRAYQRKVALADFDGICSGDILVFEADKNLMRPELLPFLVASNTFFEHAVKTSAGSLSPRTKWKDLAKLDLLLPTDEHQMRISALFACAEDAVSEWKRVSKACKSMREALISQLCEEQLSYPTSCIKDIGYPGRQAVQVGPFGGMLSSRHFTASGTPVLKINNITTDYLVDDRDLVYVSSEYASTLGRYRVSENDLLTAAQATTGRSALVPAHLTGSLISQHLIRVAADPNKCAPEYLLLCFMTPSIGKQITAVKQKTTRDGLNTSDVENFIVHVPDLATQARYVQAFRKIGVSLQLLNTHIMKSQRLTSGLVSAFFVETERV